MLICSGYVEVLVFCEISETKRNGFQQDYLSQNPESIHQVLILFSDRGTPDGYHNMHGYSGHTFKYVKADGSYVYTQIHVRADKGFKVLDGQKAGGLAGSNPEYGTQSLFEAIENQQYPSWTVYIVSVL